VILVLAATEAELGEVAGGRVCGVGPVDAAANAAAAIAEARPSGVLNVGIAGSRAFDGPRFVVGSDAVYADADDPRWIPLHAAPDERLVAAARRALPDAVVAPIATSARVGGSGAEIEAMEGYAVLRAAALAGVPAVEVRVLSNAIGEPDRARWRFADARELLASELPGLLEELARA